MTLCSLVPADDVVVMVQEDVMISSGFKTNLRLAAFLVGMLLYPAQLELASCFSASAVHLHSTCSSLSFFLKFGANLAVRSSPRLSSPLFAVSGCSHFVWCHLLWHFAVQLLIDASEHYPLLPIAVPGWAKYIQVKSRARPPKIEMH